MRLGERDATFDVGNVRLTTSLIEGEYPNYRQLIPDKYPNRLTMGKEPLLAAIRRVRLLAAESNNIRVKMSAEGVVLEAINQNLGQAEEDLDDVKYEGADMTVAFNPGYLSDGVEAVDSDTVVLDARRWKPAVVRSPESGSSPTCSCPSGCRERCGCAGFGSPTSATSSRLSLELPAGLTSVVGDNGQGKTNLLESVAYLQLDSFRGASTEALVRMGATTAVVREVEREERELLIEAELGAGRSRVQVNRQRLAHADLLGALRVTVFAPMTSRW